MKKLPVRQRILNTATQLFYKQGIKNTGINQIITESQVAKASFYQYFPSKNDLVLATLDEYYISLGEVIKRLAESCESITDFFRKWIRLIKKNAVSNDDFRGCPIANMGFQVDPADEKLKIKFNQIIDGWYKILEPLFQKSVKQKKIPPQIDFKKLFIEIFAINEGALLMWRLTGKWEYLNDILKVLYKAIE